ncbi:alpha-hydroxy-acid oxidizing protein [Antribacter gilvus]|uniref:alpha-hydroxy-acid oxidizing protein n=1 Tax=Antribacter gilvus TaxID=2304675 RepID=UPI000F770694|nr:alpha-hydroxy-acid oxidizing protein [Antribacter gilvus]
MRNVSRAVQSKIYSEGVYGRRPVVPTSGDRLEQAARRVMTPQGWSYVAGGAGMQRTVEANTAAFRKYPVVPRQLVDVGERSLTTTLLGRELPAPVVFGPVGALELAVQHRRGRRGGPDAAEPALARAARDLGLPVVISSQASTPMEATAAALGDSPRWFQLYWSSSDDLVDSFVARAEACGAEALVVTTDTHLLGWRTRDLDLGYLPFARAEGMAQYLTDPVFLAMVERRCSTPQQGRAVTGSGRRPTLAALSALASMARHHPGPTWKNLRSPLPRAAVETFLDVFSRSTLTWADLERLSERTRLPILVKGVQHPDDARAALDHGATGVIVSNHGGRQLDNAVASLDTLPAIVAAIAGRGPVLFDSGIRTGADVFTALALGADAVLLGRPWVYGLALAGADGVRAVTEHVLAELDITMALAGVRNSREIGRHNLAG